MSFQHLPLVYAKIFTQIFDSSIADDWQVRVVFEDLLILADSTGIVDMTPEAIASRTRIPIKIIRRALTELQKPDPRSRTPTEEGRRLVLLSEHRDWGWQITNYQKYREIRKEFDRKEYMREYMKENRPSRAKVKRASNPSLTSFNEVNCSPSTSISSSASESVPKGEVQEGVQSRKEKFHAANRIEWLWGELCKLFKRESTSRVRYSMEWALLEVAQRPNVQNEFRLLAESKESLPYFPGSIDGLLPKWESTLDRCRNYQPPKSEVSLQEKIAKSWERQSERPI